MSETRITRDKARESANWVREHSSSPLFCEHSYILCDYLDQEPDDADAMWDEIETWLVELSEQSNAYHYVFLHPVTKLFGVEEGHGANATVVIAPDYTLPQLRDKLRDKEKEEKEKN